MAEVEKAVIIDALDSFGGNQARTARLLGIGKMTLRRRIQEYKAKRGTITVLLPPDPLATKAREAAKFLLSCAGTTAPRLGNELLVEVAKVEESRQ